MEVIAGPLPMNLGGRSQQTGSLGSVLARKSPHQIELTLPFAETCLYRYDVQYDERD